MTLFRNAVVAGVISKGEVIMGWGGLLIQHGWCAFNKTDRRRQNRHCGEVKAETVGLQLHPANANTDPQTSHGCGEARRIP